MTETAYTGKDITVLEGLEPVRLRPGHVHRLDRRPRAPPPRLRGRRQRRRRGAAGHNDARRRHDPPRQLGHRARPRSRHPGRHDGGPGRLRAHRRADEAPRRRQVRRRGLQGLGRPARGRRLGRERALGVARRRGPPRRQGAPPDVRARRAADRGRGRRRHDRVRHDRLVPPRRGDLRRDGVHGVDARPAPARDGVPDPRAADQARRRARRRQDRGVPLRGRDQRLRRAHQLGQGRPCTST